MATRKKASKSKSKASAKAKPARKASVKAKPARQAAGAPAKAPAPVNQQAKILTFLWFAEEAEEAAKFYTSIFPNSRIDRVVTMQSDSPSGPPGSVKVVDFTLFGQRFQAMKAGPHHDFNDAISIVVLCETQAELDRYWNGLLKGGGQEIACGWLNDRWGLRWQITPRMLDELMADPDKAKSKRVTDAMLKMVKLDIATLKAAAKG